MNTSKKSREIKVLVKVGKEGLKFPQFHYGFLGKICSVLNDGGIDKQLKFSLMSYDKTLYDIILPLPSVRVKRKGFKYLDKRFVRYIPILKKGVYRLSINNRNKILRFNLHANNHQEVNYEVTTYTANHITISPKALKHLFIINPEDRLFNNFFISIVNTNLLENDDIIKICKKSGYTKYIQTNNGNNT